MKQHQCSLLLLISTVYFSIFKMSSSSRLFKCTTDPNRFCYVCANYIFDFLYDINETIQKRYKLCFGLDLKDHVHPWAPSKVCRNCCRLLEKYHVNPNGLPFTVPAQWRIPSMHIKGVCYFCTVDVSSRNKKTIKKYDYPNLESAIRPQMITNLKPIYQAKACTTSMVSLDELESEESDVEFETDLDEFNIEEIDKWESPPFVKYDQKLLNDNARNLGFSKRKAVEFGQSLKAQGCLEPGTILQQLLERDKIFRPFFRNDKEATYCHDIE
jgi:hypothetical protein